MVRRGFAAQGIGPLAKIRERLDRFQYKDILEDIMLPYAEEEMPLKWNFQEDKDPKHTAAVVKNWIMANKIESTKWPSHCPDFKPH